MNFVFQPYMKKSTVTTTAVGCFSHHRPTTGTTTTYECICSHIPAEIICFFSMSSLFILRNAKVKKSLQFSVVSFNKLSAVSYAANQFRALTCDFIFNYFNWFHNELLRFFLAGERIGIYGSFINYIFRMFKIIKMPMKLSFKAFYYSRNSSWRPPWTKLALRKMLPWVGVPTIVTFTLKEACSKANQGHIFLNLTCFKGVYSVRIHSVFISLSITLVFF